MTGPDQPPVSVFPGGSMYEMLFPGGLDRAALMLALLGGFTTTAEAGRVRDGWIERDASARYAVRLVTRNGGGNREDYAEQIGRLRAHPLYLRDADHEFDATYASFWFRAPTHRLDHDVLERVARDPVVFDKAHWEAALAQLLGDPGQARHPSAQADRELMTTIRDALGVPDDVVVRGFTCPACGMTSHHPGDVRTGYCGNCHGFTGRGRAT